jgi:hypothetical protein
MPYKYAKELVCDYIGAARAYMGKNFTFQGEYEWWEKKSSNPLAMHPAILDFVEVVLKSAADNNKLPEERELRWIYDNYVKVETDLKKQEENNN